MSGYDDLDEVSAHGINAFEGLSDAVEDAAEGLTDAAGGIIEAAGDAVEGFFGLFD